MEATATPQALQQEIDTDLFGDAIKEFADHLNLNGNERIMFSAKFGMGKTTFLKHFFQEKEYKEKYNVIHLFPVNYSVASNEDIFRYIKYDIIYEMLQQRIMPEEIEIKLTDTLAYLGTPKNFIPFFISMAAEVGKELGDVVPAFPSLIKVFEAVKAKHEELKTKSKDTELLLTYIDSITDEQGNYFENDIITQIIEKTLNKLKDDGDSRKENILIIDDLDRIDPEHLFRILNVFAAHFDQRNFSSVKNKYGFDKVVFVCDLDNVLNIFKAKYGLEVDFNGYFDKFISYVVFNYDSREAYIDWIVDKIRKAGVIGNLTNKNFKNLMSPVVNVFLDYRLINLRNATKLSGKFFHLRNYYRVGDKSLDSNEYLVIPILEFLSIMKGSWSGLREALIQLKDKDWKMDQRTIDWWCGIALELCHYRPQSSKGFPVLYDSADGRKLEINVTNLDGITLNCYRQEQKNFPKNKEYLDSRDMTKILLMAVELLYDHSI